MQLSANFTLEEFTRSELALRRGIRNVPDAEAIENLKVTASGMEQVRTLLGHPIFILSGFRAEVLERVLADRDYQAWAGKRSKAISQASWAEYLLTKAHPFGWAADWVCPAFGPPAECVRAVARSDIVFDQLIEEGGENGWTHTSFAPALRGEILTARFDDRGRATYTKVERNAFA